MLLATPIHPPSFSAQHPSEDSSQYRPAQDFKSLLAPIEFVEGSSTGGLAVPEGKYEPINGTPKAKANGHENTSTPRIAAPKLSATSATQSPNGKVATSLYSGVLDATWPSNCNVSSGFYNTGNSCFLNSALQCLLHTPPLMRVLLAHSSTDPCRVKKSAYCMSCSLRETMIVAHKKKNPFTPYIITNNLTTIAKHMRKGRQEDSHEFLRYAIDGLQKSCLAGYPPKIDTKLAETTWVHKIFGGRLRSRVSCRECHHNSDTYDSILDLSLDIFRQTSVKEALHTFVKMDVLKGSDKYKCEKCKKPVIAEKRFTIHDAPMVLTVHMKRFSPLGRKISHGIHYDERLSLQSAMSEGQYGPSYSLYGVICHAGSGPNSGHYYAYVKGANGHWYEKNDESVSPAQAPIGKKTAYMLFYIRDKGQALEAAVNAPVKNGIASGMKKRKVADAENEADQEDTGIKTSRPFIGPQLPSSVPSSTPTIAKRPKINDPQAESVKKKIQAIASRALQSLSQYSDGDDDDDTKEAGTTDVQVTPTPTPTASAPPSSPPVPPTSSPTTPVSVPAENFYKSSNGQKDRGKKRKSPDGEADENKQNIPFPRKSPHGSPSLIASSPQYRGKHRPRQSPSGSRHFNRGGGASNLHQIRDSIGFKPPIINTYKKRRSFGV